MQVFGHAARSVARHIRLGTILIEHAHARVRHAGRLDHHQAVAANAQMPVGKIDGQRFGAGDLPIEVFNEDIVVTRALHFGKGNLLPLRAHVRDIHQLGVPQIETTLQNIGQRVRRVDRG